MKRHTPGPWHMDEDNENASILDSSGNLVVAGEFDGWQVPFACREEGYSNALLCSKAPELLEELTNLVELLEPLEDHPSACERARRLLAAATGRTWPSGEEVKP